MEYLSKFARSCSPYTAGEQPQDRQYVKLNTNENPYPPAPKVAEAIKAEGEGALRRYPDPDCKALRAAIGAARGVHPDCVYAGNGSDEVLALCFPAFFDRGDRVAVPAVTYSFYPVFAAFFGVELVQVPLLRDWQTDTEGLLQANSKGILICNPNAPTGLALSPDTIEKVVTQAKAQGRVVIVDQAYAAFCRDDAVPLTQHYDNLLVVETMSKGYSLAGLRLGYAIGAPALIEGLKRMRDSFNSYPVDRVAQAAGIAAMESSDYYREINARVVAEREDFCVWLGKQGIPYLPSQSNFVFAEVGEGERVYRTLKEHGVLVRYFSAFPKHLRITVGTPEEMMCLKKELARCL